MLLVPIESNSLLDYCEGSKLNAHEMDRSTICAARSRANMACGYRCFGGDIAVEPIVQGAGPGRRQSIWPTRGVRPDRPGRRHESFRDRSGRAVALRGPHARAVVPRQRDGGSSGLRFCAGAPARVDADGVLHNVFVRHESGGRIELALADTATYSKAAANGMHFVTLFNGRRYEGTPGTSEFRVIEFREHGIPISTPADVIGPQDPDTKPTRELWGTGDASDIAQLQSRASSPLMALVLTVVAVPLSRLRPRQGRYGRVGFAIVVYFVYSNLLSAAKVWVEKGDLPPAVGVWWVHLAVLGLGLYLVFRESSKA